MVPLDKRPLGRRLGISFAESVVLRKVLSPVLVPVKLWLTWKYVMRYGLE